MPKPARGQPPSDPPVPALLRALREEGGLTQRDLAARLDRPQSWVHNCETGERRVDVPEFCRWAQACGVDPAAALRRLLAAERRAPERGGV